MSTPSRYKHFSIEELSCRCGRCEWANTDSGMSEEFMQTKIVPMRIDLGFPFVVTSARRCSEHDRRVSSSRQRGNGPHTTGRALDIQLSSVEQYYLLLHRVFLLRLPQDLTSPVFTGIGVNLRGNWTSRFIHVDDLPKTFNPHRPAVWTY